MKVKNIMFLTVILMVILTIGAVSAQDATAVNVTSVDDGSTDVVADIGGDDEVLEIDVYTSVMESSINNTVTKDNFNSFFSQNGTLLDSVTADELIFEGNLSDVNVSNMTITKPVKLIGKQAILDGVTFIITSDNVTVEGFTLTHSDVYLFDAEGVNNISILNNVINFRALKGSDSYAIYANMVDNLKIMNNNITYVGNTEGENFNNAIRAEKVTNSKISGNKFNLTLVSSCMLWKEIPAGSYNWVSFHTSEGIVIEECDDAEFENNVVNLTYNDIVGADDTIYAVSLKNSVSVTIIGNNITALGHNFIYGISICANDSSIKNNVLNITSDYDYACGIDIGLGPSDNIVVENNKINLNAPTNVYGIYSYQSLGSIDKMLYKNNIITGSSYYACGLDIFENYSTIQDNTINLSGNYTVGIDVLGKAVVENNRVVLNASNIGNTTIFSMGATETVGIFVKNNATVINNTVDSNTKSISLIAGSSKISKNNLTGYVSIKCENNTLTNNSIITGSDYAVEVNSTGNVIADNNLKSNMGIGDVAINSTAEGNVIGGNKGNSYVEVADMIFEYGKTGISQISNLTGADGVIANIIGFEAIINITDNNITVSGLNPGEYTLNVTTIPKENYIAFNTLSKVTVTKLDSPINIDISQDEFIAFDEFAITITNITAVNVTINDKSYNVKSDGTVDMDTSSLDAGNYTVTASNSENQFYKRNSTSKVFTIAKKASEVKITVGCDYKVGDSFEIAVVNSSAVNVTVNNVSYDVIDGKVAVDTASLSAGTYTVVATVKENNKYLANKSSAVFNISKKTAAVQINISDCSVGDNVSALIGLTEGIMGSVDVYLDDVLLGNADISGGKGEFNISSVLLGLHDLRVVFSGNDIYLACEKSTKFIVSKKTLNPTVTYNDEGFILVILPDDFSGEVNFTIGNIFRNFTETGDVDVRSLSAGNYTYTADYAGDDYYNAISIRDNLRITKSLPSFEINAFNIQYGENQSVNIILPDDLSDKVNYTLYKNKEVLDKADLNGSLIKNYTGLSIANYIIKLHYAGDANYYEHQLNRTFTVLPKVIMTQKLVITNFGKVYMDLGTASGSIQLFIDNEYYDSQRISAGKVNYTMPTDELSLGNHEVTFKYVGNSFNEDIFTYWHENSGQFVPITYALEILPIEIKAEVKSDEITYLTATIFDDFGEIAFDAKGSVEFFVNGERYAVVDIVNGVAKLDVSGFKNGNYVIEWRYSGDNKYNASSGNSTININYKITAKNLSKVYLSSNKYSVTVYGDDKPVSGVEVTFLINNKVYKTVKTNKKGVASISISKVPGKYKITTKALSLSTTKTLKVTHVVSLKSVKVKKSAKKLVLTATLKKISGKYLKYKKVTFKFNGKKYTAKTNKKGIAKVTVKKAVLKKLKVGKKVTYQVTYKKDTVKESVKVKK